jgi:DNA-binding transcriptional LysR family regulator
MELGQLRTLRELRDRGSIAAVAAAFRLSPAAISQQLAALQRSAGVQLTRRDGRRTVLTDAGLALADAAVDVLAAMAGAREAVDRWQRSAVVTVSAFASAATEFFPALLAASAPGLPRLRLTDFDVAHADYALLAADVDLVVAHRLPGRPWPGSVRALPLLDEPLDIAMRRGHPLDVDTAASAADLADAEWIHVHEGFPLADSLARLRPPDGRDPVIAHRVNDWAITARMLAASDRVALIARHTGRAYLGDDIVLRPLAPEAAARRSIDVLARPETLGRAAVRAVVEVLRDHARTLMQPDSAEPERPSRRA